MQRASLSREECPYSIGSSNRSKLRFPLLHAFCIIEVDCKVDLVFEEPFERFVVPNQLVQESAGSRSQATSGFHRKGDEVIKIEISNLPVLIGFGLLSVLCTEARR